MILFALLAAHVSSKIENSIFQMVSLHSSNLSINFAKMTIQSSGYFSISPSSSHPKFEFHNLRAIRGFTPFLLSNYNTKFDLSLSSSHFTKYLSSVISQNNVEYQHYYNSAYTDNSKEQLYNMMEMFYNSSLPYINISNCKFQNITGNQYNDMLGAALRLITNYNGEIIITDSQFINCRTDNLAFANNIVGGALYIGTSSDNQLKIDMRNLVFSQCNSFTGAAFMIKSQYPINHTQVYCRNINITQCINLPHNEYFETSRKIVDIENCLIEQFSNILFEDMKNSYIGFDLLSFTNCDGIVSSLQFKDIELFNFGQTIGVYKTDTYPHTLIFDGIGFQNIKNSFPIAISNNENANNLNVIIDNLHYPGTDYMALNGNVSVSVSITFTETEGMNIITPSASPAQTPSPSLTATESPSLTETPTPSASETPMPSVTETPTHSPSDSPTPSVSETPTESPTESATESPTETPTESPTEPPTETPTESATETPTESPSETPTESATETPTESPSETPTESATELFAESPSQWIVESQSESQAGSLFEPSTKDISQSHTFPISQPLTSSSSSSSSSSLSSSSQSSNGNNLTTDYSISFNGTDFTDVFNPNINERSVSGNPDVGLIVGCTVAGIVLIIAIILIVFFCCLKKTCNCCERTAFQPSDEESKTELCFFDESLNQAQ